MITTIKTYLSCEVLKFCKIQNDPINYDNDLQGHYHYGVILYLDGLAL